jgi:hypothetical protein
MKISKTKKKNVIASIARKTNCMHKKVFKPDSYTPIASITQEKVARDKE